MTRALILIALLFAGISANAQYDKAKLTGILVANPWTVKSNTDRPEKKMTFSRDQSVQVERADKGGVQSQKASWNLSSPDNIRWFLNMGGASYEIIVSYTKTGSQYLKLTKPAGKDKITGYEEMNLYAGQ